MSYRKKVVRHNLQIIFKDKNLSLDKRLLIEKEYYKNLAYLILETIWCYGATPEEIYPKVVIENMEVFDHISKKGHNATILLSHIGNWELLCQWAALYIPNLSVITLYTPLHNSFLNQWILEKRGRFGVKMVSTKSTFELYRVQKKYTPAINLFAIDQNPGAPQEQFWMDFFGKKAPIISGAEKFAKSTKQHVYYLEIRKSNGVYRLKLLEIPHLDSPMYELTKKQIKFLENNILENPALWLLSHNRWKHTKVEK